MPWHLLNVAEYDIEYDEIWPEKTPTKAYTKMIKQVYRPIIVLIMRVILNFNILKLDFYHMTRAEYIKPNISHISWNKNCRISMKGLCIICQFGLGSVIRSGMNGFH